ncbi:UNVERIFIED_CONTAM: hypothetical protein Slati_1013700 [Sesamum latifolium]|uniref:Disease resistance R13L4/SHOC-2-like LRR domain-containing protein n=1 Tax=Sesamum latifolium TaxID=2727402 RepID=A0AAW2XRY4_9LAMI
MFRFLKILILEDYKFESGQLPKGIRKLVLLKLLSIKNSFVEELLASVCKLSYLQSLNLQVHSHIKLPNSIYKMKHLRHLYLLPRWSRSIIGGGKLKLDGLNELETLIEFDSRIDDVTHLLKLQKIRVFDGTIWDEESLSMIVDHILNHQGQFRYTKLFIEGSYNMSQEKDGSTLLKRLLMCHSLTALHITCGASKLCRNVTILKLEDSKIEEDPMEILEKLPILRQHHLNMNAYVGKEMVCGATGFPQLRELWLDGLPNLVEWRAEKGAMPNLSILYINHCKKL